MAARLALAGAVPPPPDCEPTMVDVMRSWGWSDETIARALRLRVDEMPAATPALTAGQTAAARASFSVPSGPARVSSQTARRPVRPCRRGFSQFGGRRA